MSEPQRYRTIVADPPWHYDGFPSTEATGQDKRLAPGKSINKPMPYPSMMAAWGFTYKQALLWVKPGVPPFGGSVARNFVEFLIVATKGKPERLSVAHSNVITASKSKAQHSRKPEAFLDLVEAVSPGPYVELFARRARFGWDYWGDQSLGTAHMEMAA